MVLTNVVGDAKMIHWQQRFSQLPSAQTKRERQAFGGLVCLLSWLQSAGAGAVLESTMRNMNLVSFPSLLAAVRVGANMVWDVRLSNLRAVAVVASMAATIRKLLHMRSAANFTPDSPAAVGRPSPLTHADREWSAGCVQTLSTALTCLHRTMQSKNGSTHAHLSFPGMPDQSRLEHESHHEPATSQQRTWLLRQTVTALVLCLLQVCALQAGLEWGGGPSSKQQPQWYSDVRSELGKMGGDPGAMSKAMLQAPGVWDVTASETISASVYESFTTPACRQTWLPGCCHLGCTNLDGPSEASLCTLLCSGCRRARYCSVGCQRMAWIDGHNLYCGT